MLTAPKRMLSAYISSSARISLNALRKIPLRRLTGGQAYGKDDDVRIVRTICNIATAVAIVYIIGLAGASDADAISIEQLLIRGTVSMIVLVAATVIKKKSAPPTKARCTQNKIR